MGLRSNFGPRHCLRGRGLADGAATARAKAESADRLTQVVEALFRGPVQGAASWQVVAAAAAAAARVAMQEDLEEELGGRLDAFKAGLQVHRQFDEVNGFNAHSVGGALVASRGVLTPEARQAARRVQRRANQAR